MDKLIILISKEFTKDEIGQDIPDDIKREVFAEEKSITQNEFFAAGQTGLKPSIAFLVWDFEYMGENELIYGYDTYNIYRTYKKGERIELYCEVRIGGKKK